MIVHLVASIREPKVDTPYLQQIVETIHDHGAVLADNWLETTADTKQKKTASAEEDLEAIKRCDIVIADITHYSFSQGFLVAAAFEHKKPVLAVSRGKAKGHTAGAIKNALFMHKEYSDNDELTATVRSFLDKNTIHTKDLRFNMFLTRPIFQYLEETSRETSKSRSEIIRELVKRKANEDTHA